MNTKTFAQILLTIFFLCGSVLCVVAQDEGSKGIEAEVFIGNRPAASAARKSSGLKRATYKTSQRLASQGAPPPGKEFAQVGLTIWRFRASTAADKTKELVEEEGAPPSEWTLERIPEGTLLAPGQKVRLGIESLSRDGYLYVIDREQYSDGSFGDARLVFPTKRTPAEETRVKAGKITYLPAHPRYFRIRPSLTSKGHVAETLSIIVSSKPLVDPAKIAAGPVVIERAQLESWEKQWGVTPTKFEMEGGAGQTMTDIEQAAGIGPTELTQSGPVPQTVFRLTVKPDDVLLVTVPLRFQPKP